MAHDRASDVASVFHLHSSNVRARTVDLTLDEDRRPFRFRSYPGAPRIVLPGRDHDGLDVPLGALLRRRASNREFSTEATLPAESLGRLLFASYGVHGERVIDGQRIHARPTPSAGSLYPIELYVAVQRVEGVADGLYHYDARAHELELRRAGAVQPQLADMTIGQGMLTRANVVVLMTAVFDRTMWKYKQRGYRYVWLDAGHVGQNLYLVADALGLGVVAVGGFYDAELARLLALPDGEEAVVYLVCTGVRVSAAR
ncbi:MAG TPA: SagB/ThcOx family dehydrogenase [Gemmatirosa sp.]